MHRSERYWQDPLAFKPQRFLPGTPEAEEVGAGVGAVMVLAWMLAWCWHGAVCEQVVPSGNAWL